MLHFSTSQVWSVANFKISDNLKTTGNNVRACLGTCWSHALATCAYSAIWSRTCKNLSLGGVGGHKNMTTNILFLKSNMGPNLCYIIGSMSCIWSFYAEHHHQRGQTTRVVSNWIGPGSARGRVPLFPFSPLAHLTWLNWSNSCMVDTYTSWEVTH